MTIKDGLSASQRLPMEIILPICLLAAENDRRSAYTMAFVSKQVSQLTANARWSTVLLTSVRQFFAFFKVVNAVPDELYDRCMLDLSPFEPSLHPLDLKSIPRSREMLASAYSNKRKLRRTRGISLPIQGEPQDHVRHLYIDFNESDRLDKGGFNHLLALLRTIEGNSSWDYSPDSRLIWGSAFSPHPKSTQELMDVADTTRFKILHLCLGARAYGFLQRFENYFEYEELTIIYHRTKSKIGSSYLGQYDEWDADSEEEEDNSDDEEDDETTILDLLRYSTTKRLHLIDEITATKSSHTEFPWDVFSELNDTVKGLTHLRYDGPETAFEPPHFASKVRTLLEEATLHENTFASLPLDGNRTMLDTEEEDQQGPTNRRTSSLIPIQHHKDSAFVRYLREEMAVGHLEFVQFAWLSTMDIPTPSRKATEEAGPASLFLKDNYDDDNNGIHSALAIDLRTTVAAKFGWDAAGVQDAFEFVAKKYSIPEEERKSLRLDNHAFSPDESVLYYQRIKNGFDRKAANKLQATRTRLMRIGAGETSNSNVSPPFLQNGIRAPQSLLYLGGKVAYTRQDRLTFFLDRATGSTGAWP